MTHHDRTAEQKRHAQADDGQNGRKGISERVPPHHPCFANTLRPGGTDIVLPDSFQQASAREPHQTGRAGQAEDQNGEGCVGDTIGKNLPARLPVQTDRLNPGSRQPVQIQRKKRNE